MVNMVNLKPWKHVHGNHGNMYLHIWVFHTMFVVSVLFQGTRSAELLPTLRTDLAFLVFGIMVPARI